MGTFREPRGGMVVFVGAGPGDPELLTIRGRRVIEQADLVIWADSLVHPGVAALARSDAEVLGSASMTLEAITARMIERQQEPGAALVGTTQVSIGNPGRCSLFQGKARAVRKTWYTGVLGG